MPAPTDSGHLSLSLGQSKTRYVHVLVAEAFLGPRPPGRWALHRNDIPSDNRVENLYWGTSAENARDALLNGRNANAKKATCPRGHLLVGPNLLLGELRRGRRKCRACQQAHSHFSNMRRSGTPIEVTPASLQMEADRRYAALMA